MKQFTWILKLQSVVVRRRRRLLPPGLNQRVHWSIRSEFNAEFRRQVWQLCKEAGVPKLGKAKVTVMHYAVRPMDRDNLFGSCKALIDGIVDAHVIPDDSSEYIRQECESVKLKHKQYERVEILVEAQ